MQLHWKIIDERDVVSLHLSAINLWIFMVRFQFKLKRSTKTEVKWIYKYTTSIQWLNLETKVIYQASPFNAQIRFVRCKENLKIETHTPEQNKNKMGKKKQ